MSPDFAGGGTPPPLFGLAGAEGAYSVLPASPGEPGVIKAAQTHPFLIFAI
jgi:hypothetical protein